MQALRTIIIEDENLAATRLQNLILKLDASITVEAILPSVKESVKWLSNNPHPDLLFMDIHLDDGQSFAIFDQVEINAPVVFTTAYDDYMIKAFKVNSIGYLLKPINTEELAETLTKYRKLNKSQSIDDEMLRQLLAAAMKKEPEYKSRFLISLGNKIKTLTVDEIRYFYSEDKLSFVVTQEGQKLPVDFSLDKLTNILDPKLFFRVNRQFLVKMDALAAMHKYSATRLKLELEPPAAKDVFVSIEKYSAFKNWLDS